jgi:hypothetical protein
MADVEPSVNIPSLVTLAVISFFVIRWFLNRNNPDTANAVVAQARGRIIDPAQVEQISQMFPQLNRRDIMWDLQRNGGSVPATTERILTGRGLDTVSTSSLTAYGGGLIPLTCFNTDWLSSSLPRHTSLIFHSLQPLPSTRILLQSPKQEPKTSSLAIT